MTAAAFFGQLHHRDQPVDLESGSGELPEHQSLLLEATEDAAGNVGLLLDDHLNQLVQSVQAAIRQSQYDLLVEAVSLDERLARVPVLTKRWRPTHG